MMKETCDGNLTTYWFTLYLAPLKTADRPRSRDRLAAVTRPVMSLPIHESVSKHVKATVQARMRLGCHKWEPMFDCLQRQHFYP